MQRKTLYLLNTMSSFQINDKTRDSKFLTSQGSANNSKFIRDRPQMKSAKREGRVVLQKLRDAHRVGGGIVKC